MTYNGFTNVETENVFLWMNTDEKLSHKFLEILEQPDPPGELKRFVTYVFDRVGVFGNLETKEQLKKVNWEQIIERKSNRNVR